MFITRVEWNVCYLSWYFYGLHVNIPLPPKPLPGCATGVDIAVSESVSRKIASQKTMMVPSRSSKKKIKNKFRSSPVEIVTVCVMTVYYFFSWCYSLPTLLLSSPTLIVTNCAVRNNTVQYIFYTIIQKIILIIRDFFPRSRKRPMCNFFF